MADFIAVFEKEIRKKTKQIVDESVTALRRFIVEETYDALLFYSPVYSGYYKANHRITVSGGTFKLDPPNKPEFAPRFSFVDKVPEARDRELSKLERMTPFTKVRIGTAVPYAGEVESNYQVYQLAVVEGQVRGKQRFDQFNQQRRA